MNDITSLNCRKMEEGIPIRCVGTQRRETLEGIKFAVINFRDIDKVRIETGINYETTLDYTLRGDILIRFMFPTRVTCELMEGEMGSMLRCHDK